MQTELVSQSKAFTENLFRIPDYQRGYSWGEKQLKEFWSDVEQLEDGESHYTGVLTLEDVPKRIYDRWDDDTWIIYSKSYRPYFVVDGQQRLTTLIVLVTCILEKINGGGTLNYDTPDEVRKRFVFLSKDGGLSRSYIFGYEKDNPSYEFLKKEIFGEDSERHSSDEDTVYTKNLAFAKKYFTEKVSNFSTEEVEKVYTKVTQNLLFNIFTISDGIDVHVTFETMNNRGKALSHLELLKNRLIYLSTKLSGLDLHDKNSLRSLINESWKTAYHFLGKGRAGGSDDFYLDIQSLCYFAPKMDKSKQAERRMKHFRPSESGKFLLDEVFNARRLRSDALDRLTAADIRAYSMDMKKTVEVFHGVLNPDDYKITSEERVWLERIRRQEFTEAAILLVAAYKARHALPLRIELLKSIECYLFFRGINGYFFYEHAQGGLRALALNLASKSKTLAEVVKEISDICSKFKKSAELKSALKHLGKNKNYYRWSPTRYFLFEYEQSLLDKSKTARNKLSWEDFSEENWGVDYVTLEHIYPQKAAVVEWKAAFNAYTVPQRNLLKNSLGNLTPLSRRKNSSLGNKSFKDKKGSSSTKSGYCYGCYSEIEISQENDWTPQSIVDRGVRLLKFMSDRWLLDLGSDKEMVKLLGLDFVSTATPQRKN